MNMNGVDFDMSEEQLMRTSFLTLGGWDERDYSGDIVWFDTIEDQVWN